MAGLSQRAFARRAGVAQQSVMNAAHEGRLHTEAGKLDPEHPVNAAFIASHRNGNGANGTAAQLGALIAKANLTRHAIDRTEAEYLDRAEVAELWAEHARLIQARLATLPDRQAGRLAQELGCTLATARSILEQFTVALRDETQAFEEQARDTILQLR
jgi:hypothetical protein